MDKNLNWSNQIAVVTGGSGDIGAEVVRSLLAAGVKVASADLSPFPNEDSLSKNTNFFPSIVDVANSKEVDEWIDKVTEKWGTPTIAVIGATIVRNSTLIETSDADWDAVISVGLTSSFYVARAVIKKMLLVQAQGRIVFIGSWAASNPHPHIGSYSVMKAGTRALMQNLALEYAHCGILINEVAPGIVDAGLSKALFDKDPTLKARALESIPVNLTLTTKDVARDILYLCSPENLVTTGIVLTSDGGLSITSTMNTGLPNRKEK